MKCIVLECNEERAIGSVSKNLWKNRFCYYHRRYPPKEWPCLLCQKNFNYSTVQKQYCDNCVKELNRINSRKHYQMKREQRILSRVGMCCITCGNQLSLHSNAKLYCSRKCGGRWFARKRMEERKRSYTKENCLRCGSIFIKNHPKKKFCSRKCQLKVNLQNYRMKQKVLLVAK